MSLTIQQRQVLHYLALTIPELQPILSSGDDPALANYFNSLSSPEFTVWRTSVTQDEYQSAISSIGTAFSWSGTGGFIARSQGERDAWSTIFQNPLNAVNPSNSNVITAFNDIFSGSGAQAVNNRTHLLALSKRLAKVAEQLLATGTGSNAVPAILTYEGDVSIQDASLIRVGE